MLTLEQRLRMLEVPQDPIDLVLDTDAYNEIDDQFAISYALKVEDRIHLKALYAAPFHNSRSSGPEDGMERSYDEILKLLRLAGRELPVFKGSRTYLADEKTPVGSPAAADLAQRAASYTPEKPLYVVAIGAITNVASAILMNPDIADRMVVVWLGGNALEWQDNNEFNVAQDVAAARVVFNCGVPLVMLTCAGVVHAVTTTGPELSYWLSGKNALCDYLVQQTADEANSYAAGKPWSRIIWDIAPVGWLLSHGKKFMYDRLIPTPIPQYDHHWSVDHRRPLCRYVTGILRDGLFEDLFETLVN